MTLVESIVRLLLEDGPDIRGEYWIIDGDVEFADGDIGDMNHEAYAVDHARHIILDHFGGDSDDEIIEDSELDQAAAEALIEAGIPFNPDDWYPAAKQLFSQQPNSESLIATLQCALGMGDAREIAMRYWGWKWCRRSNIATWTFTQSDRQQIVRGLNEIISQETDEEADWDSLEITIGVGSTGKRYSMTVAELESGRVVSQDPTWGAMRESEPEDMMGYMVPEIERLTTNRKLNVGEVVSQGTNDYAILCQRGLSKLDEIHHDGYARFVEANIDAVGSLQKVLAANGPDEHADADDFEAAESLWDALCELFNSNYCKFATHFGVTTSIGDDYSHIGDDYNRFGCWPAYSFIQELIDDEVIARFEIDSLNFPENFGPDPKGRYQCAVNIRGDEAMYNSAGELIWKY